jgi:hypothetical protein
LLNLQATVWLSAKMNPERILQAVIASFGGQEGPLERMISNLVEK